MWRPVIEAFGKFANVVRRHRWNLLLGILFFAVLWGGLRSLQKELLRTRMAPETDARRSLGQLMAYLPASGERELQLFHRMYRVGNRITGDREHPRVLSAEMVLGVEDFHTHGPVLPKMLLTQDYFRVNARWRSTGAEVLQRSGSAFEIFVLPAERATNLDIESFLWSTRDYRGSRTWKHFPVMWTKCPELYHGNRVVLDVSGNRDALPEAEFAVYLQAAQDWFDDSRPLAAIDQMLAQTDKEDVVFNGLMLLKRRQEPLLLQERLERLAGSGNLQIAFRAVQDLGEFKNERAVAAIARTPEVSRTSIVEALGKTGQPGAVKHLERLLFQYRERGNSRDEIRFPLEIIAALARIPTPESRELLGKLEKDSLSSVSEAAKAALKTISPK